MSGGMSAFGTERTSLLRSRLDGWTGDAQRHSMRDGAPLRLVAKPQQRDKDPRESGERRRHEDKRREPAAEHVLIEERAYIVRERRGEVGDRHQRCERKAF